jgi:hypothetical protein
MERIRMLALVIFSLAISLPSIAAPKHQPNTGSAGSQKTPTAEASSEGERLFGIHCGRCHQPPDDIPRAAAGTILKHMRIRASLSRQEEQLILHYIRP